MEGALFSWKLADFWWGLRGGRVQVTSWLGLRGGTFVMRQGSLPSIEWKRLMVLIQAFPSQTAGSASYCEILVTLMEPCHSQISDSGLNLGSKSQDLHTLLQVPYFWVNLLWMAQHIWQVTGMEVSSLEPVGKATKPERWYEGSKVRWAGWRGSGQEPSSAQIQAISRSLAAERVGASIKEFTAFSPSLQ